MRSPPAASSSGDVVVVRYQGPQGGPGMPEMTHLTSAIVGAGLVEEPPSSPTADSAAAHKESRWATSRPRRGGGPLAILRDGDVVEIDAEASRLQVDLPDEEIAVAARRRRAPGARYPTGVLAKYARLVGSAATGARVGA